MTFTGRTGLKPGTSENLGCHERVPPPQHAAFLLTNLCTLAVLVLRVQRPTAAVAVAAAYTACTQVS